MATVPSKIKVPISTVTKDITLTVELYVTGIRWFKLRLWMGAQLIKLAAFVCGTNLELKVPK